MTDTDCQLALAAFDTRIPPLCGGDPDRAYRRLCRNCPHARRRGGGVYCLEYECRITARSKYGLSSWKKTREIVIARDGGACTLCGRREDLHVHHINGDATCDDLSNLTTLCSVCHARVHAGRRRNEPSQYSSESKGN